MDETRDLGGNSNQVIEDPPPPYPGDELSDSTLQPASPTLTSPALATPVPRPTKKFPRLLKGYRLEEFREQYRLSYHLGPSVGQPMFRLCTQYDPYLGKRVEEVIHFHNTPSNLVDEIIATVERKPCVTQKRHVVITLHAVPGVRDEEMEVVMHAVKGPLGTLRRTLEFQVDIGGYPEDFQWRPSGGEEFRTIAG